MKCLIITPNTDAAGSGFPFRVNGLSRLVKGFCACEVFDARQLLADDFSGKLDRLSNCYKTRYPIGAILPKGEWDFVFIESLDLFFLGRFFPDSKIVYDAHNIGWELLPYDLFNSPLVKRLPFGKFLLVKWLCMRGKRFEKKALSQADTVLACSEADRKKYASEMPEIAGKIFVLPNCIDVSEYSPKKAMQENTALFFGSFDYSANIDAARIIDEKIAQKLPGVKFLLVGKNAKALKIKSKNVELLDFLPFSGLKKAISNAAVVIVPLRFGSGTRIKILQAFALEKAVVSTSKGAEGIKAENGRHLLIEDNLEKFAEKISLLLENKRLRVRLGKNARRLVEGKYDWRLYSKSLEGFLSERFK